MQCSNKCARNLFFLHFISLMQSMLSLIIESGSMIIYDRHIVENRVGMVIRIEERKTGRIHTDFTWFSSVPTSTVTTT